MTADLEAMASIARFHRRHERFHATSEIEEAAAIRRDAAVLRSAGGDEPPPREPAAVRARLEATADRLERASRWLAEKMEAGWRRESVLLTPEFADVAFQRHMALTRTTLRCGKRAVAARLLRAGAAAGDPRLLDAAAALLATGAAELSRSDPDWTTYTEALNGRLRRGAV